MSVSPVQALAIVHAYLIVGTPCQFSWSQSCVSCLSAKVKFPGFVQTSCALSILCLANFSPLALTKWRTLFPQNKSVLFALFKEHPVNFSVSKWDLHFCTEVFKESGWSCMAWFICSIKDHRGMLYFQFLKTIVLYLFIQFLSCFQWKIMCCVRYSIMMVIFFLKDIFFYFTEFCHCYYYFKIIHSCSISFLKFFNNRLLIIYTINITLVFSNPFPSVIF